MLDPETRDRVLAALGFVDARAFRLRVEAEFAGVTRHLPGKHDQKSHGRRGGVVKRAVTGAAALLAAPIAVEPTGSKFARGVEGDLADELDSDCFDYYRSDGFENINDALRATSGKAKPDDFEDEESAWTVSAMDVAFGHSRLTQPVRVYRGVADVGFFGESDDLTGSLSGLEFREWAYTSTTADWTVAREFLSGALPGDEPAVIALTVPAGVGAIQLSSFGKPPRGGNRDVSQESELLLERGLRVRIVGDTVQGGVRVLEAEVVPA